jgi:hypothetical protein
LSGVKHPPSAELRIRVDDAIGRAFLDRVGIRNYCVAKGVDPGSLREELKVMGVLVDDNHKIVLGKGTTFKSAQTRCWEIDMNHHAMTGVAGFVTMSQPTSAAVIPMAGRKIP